MRHEPCLLHNGEVIAQGYPCSFSHLPPQFSSPEPNFGIRPQLPQHEENSSLRHPINLSLTAAPCETDTAHHSSLPLVTTSSFQSNMPQICTGASSANNCDNVTPTKPMIIAAVDAIRDLLDRGRATADNISSPVSARERRRLQLAESYIQLRMDGNNQKLLHLVSEDIELQSSRDGTFVGKQQFESYLSKVKPTGTWQNATWNNAIDRAEILGNVKILMLNVGVVAHMGFNKSGKINRIYVGTRSKSPK